MSYIASEPIIGTIIPGKIPDHRIARVTRLPETNKGQVITYALKLTEKS